MKKLGIVLPSSLKKGLGLSYKKFKKEIKFPEINGSKVLSGKKGI